ncbi:folylpolyglutamate synthase/dihydrofolate synthase family protein [Magnetovibrio sp. PR-2]|uniref:bifunctional folylpolyglutamate synthase/dihydrofolate synthase n=1 Tax=Magnetovibrio sp. PR-2 TaxID=3120356 RepID=UPI002FCE411D
MCAAPTDDILARLMALHPKSIDLSLDRLERLLAALGNPEQKLPPVVHIAGTNGKGSTTAFLRAFAEAAGLRVHVYTSPHLVKFNERIRVSGQIISDAELSEILETCETANAGQPITFFEITTAAAFVAFVKHPADLVILETGLGGRLDATNVIDKPRLTAITPISLDHQHFLGDTIEEIAAEKAGIFKPGVDCVVAAQGTRAAEKVLRKQGKEVGCRLTWEGKDWFARTKGGRRAKGDGGLIYKGHGAAGETERAFPEPALAGRHQVRNAALAMACVEALQPDFNITDAAITIGLRAVRWPGRMQQLTEGPLVDGLSDGWELWLDGGHNRAAAEMIAQHSRTWRGEDLWLVFGALNQRPPLEFLKPLEGKILGTRTVAIVGEENTLTAAEGAKAANHLHMNAAPADGVADAVKSIADAATRPGRILICGSLYLAGQVLAENT